MSHDKYVQILRMLAEKTKLGELDWKETGDQDIFQISFAENSILIRDDTSRSRQLMTILIVNSSGDIVDQFDDEDLSRDDFMEDPLQLMRDIFESARRSALGTDKILDEILEVLKRKTKK